MPDSARQPPDAAPHLQGLRFGVAGPGRVGRSLARWAVAQGADLKLIVSRNRAASAGTLPPSASLSSLTGAIEMSFEALSSGRPWPTPLDFVLLTVSDEALATVAADWARRLARRDASAGDAPRVVLHCAGCFDAEVLSPLRDVGIAVGSLHPLRAFPDEVPDPGSDPFFAVDGDAEAVALARRMVGAWGGKACELSGERRVTYHLAASLAAGGVVTVLAAVTELMRAAELPDEVLGGYLGLLRGAVDAAEHRAVDEGGPARVPSAITGPAARGDEATLDRHREALRAMAPELTPLVETLWSETRRFVDALPPRAHGGAEKDSGDASEDGSPPARQDSRKPL